MKYVMTRQFAKDALQHEEQAPDGRWTPARPYRLRSLANRLRDAWLVVRGKADVLLWVSDLEQGPTCQQGESDE